MAALTIALFGATGHTGRLVIAQALDSGYTARALARRPEAVTQASDHLTIVPGDALDRVAVEQTVRGSDVVISVFGYVRGSSPMGQATPTAAEPQVRSWNGFLEAVTRYPTRRFLPGADSSNGRSS